MHSSSPHTSRAAAPRDGQGLGRRWSLALGLATLAGLLTAAPGLIAGFVAAPATAKAKAKAQTASTRASSVPIMPVDAIKPGMKGYGVTVFSGTQSDRFEIEVIDIIPDYLTRQPAILFRSPDPRLLHSGIVGGMSGSPIYIEGKLVGALAYGYRFNKDPIGGISPIENMLEVDALPYRPEVLPRPSTGAGRSTAQARAGTRGWADAMLGLDVSPLPPRRRPADLNPVEGLTTLESPLSVGGFGPAATRALSEQFGMIPVRGGARGGVAKMPDGTPVAKKAWKGGDSLSVLLARGDNAIDVNGTVTWVGGKQGERLLAFGHPMFDIGPTNVPIADARVHVIIPSVQRSVKLASSLTTQGTMVQDRQSAIAVRTDITAPMIPVVTHMRPADPDMPAREYKSEVAFGLDLTPGLTGALLVDAASEAGTDEADLTAVVRHEIAFTTSKGPREITVEEEMFFPLGMSTRVIRSARGLLVLAALLDNQFEVARVRSIKQSLKLEYGDPIDAIEAVRVAQDDVHAGDLLKLEIDLRRRHGELRTETLELRVPDDAGEQEIIIHVTGGDGAVPYSPMPKTLDDLIDNVERTYPSRSMVATIYREHEGLSTRHGLLEDIPDSVLETLTPQGRTTPAVRFKKMARRVIPTKRIIEGEHRLSIDVLPRRGLPRR
ncbi:MAG: hypothetical protein H6713_06960 [Myxococcales bacterium]|nr:hypothetical protein [Myxococcales bacterium]MCB9749733.1 hypothetical protein [Myxococcales bacterium]